MYNATHSRPFIVLFRVIFSPLLLLLVVSCIKLFGQPLSILTQSSSSSLPYPSNAIFPAFVDNTEYNSWSATGRVPYFQLKATGGNGTYTWSIANGALPTGLVLSSTGKIEGTPTTEGSFIFTVKVKSGSDSTTKLLSMQAAPYRSKWMSDAKFGIMIQWGTFCYPVISSAPQADIYTFANTPSSRIPMFSATAWVDSIKSIGAKVLNFTVKGGDGVRYWPDTAGSALNRKTQRDLVGELIAACHAGPNPIKFVAYFAPDHDWVTEPFRDYLGTSGPSGIGELNVKLIRELALKGVDGFWIDMGGTPELYDVRPEWFPWDRILPIIRSTNPYATFVANSGLTAHFGTNGGTILHWPDTDIINYENSQSWAPAVAASNSTRKKMAIEVNNLLDNQWGWIWPANQYGGTPKPAVQIIESIKKNWQVGATYILNYPVPADGTIFPGIYRQTLKDIGGFVNANQGWSITPSASLATGNYPTSQSVTLSATNVVIYYTLDGSYPTENSTLYASPISITKNTRLRAISIETGKGASRPLDNFYTIGTQNLDSFVKFSSGITLTEQVVDNNQYYRGIKFSVGPKSILIQKLGRYFSTGNVGRHDLIIKRFHDDETLLLASIDMAVGTADASGFKYTDVTPVLLEAGKTYIIASRENPTDKFLNCPANKFVLDQNIKNISKINLNSNGGKRMVTQDGGGQILNFKYTYESDDDNLALGAAAFLQDNNGVVSLPSVGTYFAENAVDANPQTVAAANAFAWTLHLDLGRVYRSVNHVKLDFLTDRYATEFQILLQNSAGSWETVYTKTGNSALHHDIFFRARDVRFLRIRSNKPDGENQAGGQMTISNVGVYANPNIAVGTSLYLKDNNGNPLTPSAGTGLAGNAIDGNPATIAQAGGSWAWTLLTDLGKSYKKITRVKLDFGPALYPTHYFIQVSKDNVNWPDTSIVVKNNGVSPHPLELHPDHWFTPKEGRYVRVGSLLPNGPGQLGGQMAIAELGIYESPNLAAAPNTRLSLQQNDGSPLPGTPQIPSSYTQVPQNAIDLNLSTAAQAGNSWAWSFLADLGTTLSGLNQINIDFATGLFATEYKIYSSTNGTTWSEIKHVSSNAALSNIHEFAQPFSARYVGIKALAPNGPNQTGAQMAIAELEIYANYTQSGGSMRTGEVQPIPVVSELTVYPNPSNGSFDVTFDQNTYKTATLKIVNSQGRTIYKKAVTGKGMEHVKLPGDVSGPVLLQLLSENGSFVSKMLILGQ